MLGGKEGSPSVGADHCDQRSKGVVEHADPRRVEYEAKSKEELVQILLIRDAKAEQVQFYRNNINNISKDNESSNSLRYKVAIGGGNFEHVDFPPNPVNNEQTKEYCFSPGV